VALTYDTLKSIKPKSTVETIGYYEQSDKQWFLKNDMSIALSEADIKGDAFDLGTLYKTGNTNPSREVMSGRSFASSPSRAVTDATDPEYLNDLSKYLKEKGDKKPFYRALVLALAKSDPSGWAKLSPLVQLVLSDFFTVYTAEAVRHLMVDLKDGLHPWEIDLAAVTVVSSLSSKIGQVVQDGQMVDADLKAWFAPSPNNKEGGPQRSGIGITRRDRTKFQRAIHAFELNEKDGKTLIAKMQAIIGTTENSDDVIQGVFEYLSSPSTPDTMGTKADALADLMAEFIELASNDAQKIADTVAQTR
jgi:hypothetical protein